MEIMTQEEVDKLFKAVANKYIPPISEIKPSEIERMEEFERTKYKEQFNNYLQVYVRPLEKLVANLLDNANREKYSYNVDDLSMLERVTLYGNILMHSGYTKEQLTSLVPKTEDEVDLLARAIMNGFDDSKIIDNETRVTEAQNFLSSLDKSENVGRRVA